VVLQKIAVNTLEVLGKPNWQKPDETVNKNIISQ
jgi:hypothetical protein